jgi:hypothetical protein
MYFAASFVLFQVSISYLKDSFIFPIVLGRYKIEIQFLARQELPKTLCPFEMFMLEVNYASFVYGNFRISNPVFIAIFSDNILLV